MSTWRSALAVVSAAGLAATLAACGTVSPGSGPGGSAETGSATQPDDAAAVTGPAAVDPEDELVGLGIVMQRTTDADPELCVGAIAESYPPQCGGPLLAGEFSWDDVEAQEQDGTRWTDIAYYAVGRWDPAAGGQGTLTLTRPLSADPPQGWEPPEEPAMNFPQLCDDPTADVPDVDQAARTAGPQGMDEEQALQQLLYEGGVEGYVTSWVSDGGPTMNVLLDADADLEEARAALRDVFTGPLCLEQRDLPSQEDVQAAQDALAGRAEELRVLSSGGGGVSGLLEVQVLVADPGTIEAIHETVAPWLTTAQVEIRSTLRSLEHG